MKCQVCGCENKAGAIYCLNCGTKLETRNENFYQSGSNVGECAKKAVPKWVWGAVGIAVILVIAAAAIAVHYAGAGTAEKENGQYESHESGKAVSSGMIQDDTDEAMNEEMSSCDETGIHSYSYILEDCGWNEAFERAKESGGYLAHINSEDEFSYIIGELENQGYHKMQFYVGGMRSGDTDYYWVDENRQPCGDRLNDLGSWFWMTNEPSFESDGAEENYMNIFYYGKESRWVVNDTAENAVAQVPEFRGHVGYIIEYDE